MKQDPDGFITALRVLARSIYQEAGSARDVNAVRRHALADEIESACRAERHRAVRRDRLAAHRLHTDTD